MEYQAIVLKVANPQLVLLQGYSSRLVALDYTIRLYSEVFVTTQGGNFPHFLFGHRRFSYEGHAKTIMPDKRKLALLSDSPNIRDMRPDVDNMSYEEDYENGDDIMTLNCGHDFHTRFIKQWLTQRKLCPICKMAVLAT
ncbi:O-fucosyltransferase 9 isoform X1 [Tanacetum coccineum]